MRLDYSEAVVSKIIRKHRTSNPFEIASQKNIKVLFGALGETLGFFVTYMRVRCIYINNAISSELQRFVCAHELGHAVLHPGINTPFMQHSTFFSTDRMELEANKFAFELLTHDAEILEGETKRDFFIRHGIPISIFKGMGYCD